MCRVAGVKWWKYFEEWGGQKYDPTKATSAGGTEPWAGDLNEVFHMQ